MPDSTLSQSGPPYSGKFEPAAPAEWAGWFHWVGNDPFEDGVGPFYVKRDSLGPVTGFRPGPAACNSHGTIHGGCLMTFGDFSLFMIAASADEDIDAVTVTFNSEFVGPARAGQLLLARGEVIKAGRSLVFARGVITADGDPVMAFSGTIKRSPQGLPR